LTKGDQNQVDDRGLYTPGQLWLERKDIVGKVKGYIAFAIIHYVLSFLSYHF
jgi:signal peptidase